MCVCVCVCGGGGGGGMYVYVHYEKSLSISFPDNAVYFPQAVKNVIIKRRLVLSENKWVDQPPSVSHTSLCNY